MLSGFPFGSVALAAPIVVLLTGCVEQAQPTEVETVTVSAADEAGTGDGSGDVLPPPPMANPVVRFSTVLGGSGSDAIRDVATDALGNIYVTGGTGSSNFPTTVGAYQRVFNPGTPESGTAQRSDVFVTKLSPAGQVIWSTLIGGPNHDRAYAIEVDANGFVIVAGRAGRGFPVTAGAFQTAFLGGQESSVYGHQDGFVCKLRPDGSARVFCSYFGTSDPMIVRDVAVAPNGDLYLASGRRSGTYPGAVGASFRNTPAGGDDAVIAKVRSDGVIVLWARYVGGSGQEGDQNSVQVDGLGNPTLLLTTTSSNAPATASAYRRTYSGNGDLFIARLDQTTGGLVWGSYLGASQNESTETHELAVDAAGNVYVAAPTFSPTFPTTAGAFQRTLRGANDVFVSRISADGSTLLASTLLGGNGFDRPEGVTVDGQGNVYLTGTTTSANFPITTTGFQTRLPDSRAAIVVKLAPDLGQLLYSSFIGGGGADFGRGIALSGTAVYFGGETSSPNWPVVNPWQTFAGGINAFLAGITLP